MDEGRSRVVFVGIARSEHRGVAPRSANDLVFRRLLSLMGISYPEFVRRFSWENLFGEEQRDPRQIAPALAEERARSFGPDLALRFDRAILAGKLVGDAFACADIRATCGSPLYEWHIHEDLPGIELARIPHPSWGNPRWHDENYAKPARDFLRSLL